MYLNRQQIIDALIRYYYMIDLHYSDCKNHILYTIEQIEERCEYLEGVLNYLIVAGKHVYKIDISYIHFGGI